MIKYVKTKVFILTLAVLAVFLPYNAHADNVMNVSGTAHVQNIGWMSQQSDVIGTTGKSLRLEALKLKGPFTAKAHVQDIGWMATKNMMDDEYNTIGTTGKSLRMEAVVFQLDDYWARTGSYLTYRCHVQNIGWTSWVRDGQVCGTTGKSLRMEAIQIRFVSVSSPPSPTPTPSPTLTPSPTPTPLPTPTQTNSAVTSIGFTADTGVDDVAGKTTIANLGSSDVQLASILGDFAYAPNREADYCNLVNANIKKPLLLAPGNHEAQNGDGKYSTFLSCMNNKASVSGGDYSTGHYFIDKNNVRVIIISPLIQLPQGTRTYDKGTLEREEVKDWIDQARADGKWVIVGMHVPCISNGIHGCEGGTSLTDMLIGKKVDVILSGHDHNYGRTHQVNGTVSALTVIDTDSNFSYGAGTVQVIAGNGGHKMRDLAKTGGIWASGLAQVPGYVRLDVSPNTLSFKLVRNDGASPSDSFVINR